MCDEDEADLFESPELLPDDMQALIEHYSREIENRDPYEVCREFLADAQQRGYTFEYGLDGQPYGLCRMVDTKPTRS
ncbi:hypothetical protein [Marinobacter salicampi]|uniref:hypothetical protein n=1 Tax=Marinobacter salicampi TaxID=435907 RepID=UPI00140B925E|nr:hypothetical protein [Marinobacter salicampi]